jgi:hypothetical protein
MTMLISASLWISIDQVGTRLPQHGGASKNFRGGVAVASFRV